MKKHKWFAVISAMVMAFAVAGCQIDSDRHEHSFSKDWTSDATDHWHAATCEHTKEVSGKAAHTFGEWKITVEATEETEGKKEHSCSVCLYKEEQSLAKLDHTHKFSSDWTSDATDHWHAATCEHTEEVSGKTTHTFGEWKTTVEATEETEGKKEHSCSVCSYKEEQSLAKLNHTHKFSSDWTSDAKDHWHAATCEHAEEVSGKAAHTFGEWKTTVEATEETEGKKERICSVCLYKEEQSIARVPAGFVYVKGGTVTGKQNTNNYPGVFIEGRTVTLSDFYMSKYEVTRDEYSSVMTGQKVTVSGKEYTLNANPSFCTKGNSLNFGTEQGKRPVEGVTWYDAVYYCNAKSKKEGLKAAYDITVTSVDSYGNIREATVTLVGGADGYRLPTEAEWEYAARGGDPSAADWDYTFSGADTAAKIGYDSFGNTGLDTVGWYCYNNDTGTTGSSDVTGNPEGNGTHQVGQKAPNALGIYDMSGNVLEWCYDWQGSVSSGEETDPLGSSSGSYREFRGGSWDDNANDASVCRRIGSIPRDRDNNKGFRLVRSAN